MAHALVSSVASFVEQHALMDPGDTVLVGVSGGIDSMVCLSVLRRLEYDVRAYHVNYGLRDGAEADEALVRRWCKARSPSVPLTVEALDAEARAETADESLQEAARRLRYDALAEHASSVGAAVVATGHHRDDQAETVLLNLVRGSGPEGLAGMRPSRPLQAAPSISLVRPLLETTGEAIEEYADAIDLAWRTDPTNRSLKYDRGVIRTEILPLLAEHFEGVRTSVARSATLVGEYVDQSLRPALQERMARAYVECRAGGWMSLDVLKGEPPVWRRRLLLEALDQALPDAPHTYALAEELAALLDSSVGQRLEVGEGTVWREREGLRFVPDGALSDPLPPTPVSWKEFMTVPQGELMVEALPEPPDTFDPDTSLVAYADANRLGSLVVRSWAEGDRFHPFGLDGTKRVSSFLTDERVPPHRREHVSVLCTTDHIAWVVGHRLDHRVRVRSETTQVARLVLRPRENTRDDCQSS